MSYRRLLWARAVMGISAVIYILAALTLIADCHHGNTDASTLGCMVAVAMMGVGYSPQTGMLEVTIAFLVLFGFGRGFYDCNPVPNRAAASASQWIRTMNLVSMTLGGIADWAFGSLRDLDTTS